jgi:hypothetical protein
LGALGFFIRCLNTFSTSLLYCHLLFDQAFTLYIASENMFKHRVVVSLCLLFYLKDMNVLRPLFNLFACNCIDKGCFTNTISPDKTILSTLDKFELRLVKKCLSSDNQSQTVNQYVVLERVWLIVEYCRRWNTLLVLHEFLDFLVKGIHSFFFFFGGFLLCERAFFLGVEVSIRAICVKEWVKELVLSIDG